MTPGERNHLKMLIDRARRERITIEDQDGRLRMCAGCGGDHDAFTQGCRRCKERHQERRLRGWQRSYCNGCGCHLDDQVPGCWTCKERFQKRRKRRQSRLAA